MKKINPLGLTGYDFNELSQEAKDKAIADQIEFWMEAREYDEENILATMKKLLIKQNKCKLPGLLVAIFVTIAKMN